MLKTIRAAMDGDSGHPPRITGDGAYSWHDETVLRAALKPDLVAGGMTLQLLPREYQNPDDQSPIFLSTPCQEEPSPSEPERLLREISGGLAAMTPLATAGRRQARPVRGLSLKEEFPLAVKVYDNAVACVREIMSGAAEGRVSTGRAVLAVEDIVSSLERNPDALLCLPRLRQRDAYIYTHCVNVSVLLAAFAMRAGKTRPKVLTFALAGLFHDLGKARLPVSLLNARRKLSPTEQTLVIRHPLLGCELLADLPEVRAEMLLAALEHHERYDGSGYPKGLSGNAISEMGHICAIADAYDAISSRRPYKGALFPHRTLGVMYQMRKKHFHPELMEKFVRLVGIYPVGSVVELKDGYRGVVTAGNYDNPMQPVVTLAMDPNGASMCLHECDLAKEQVAGIKRCLAPEISGLDAFRAMGIVLR